MSKTPRMDVGSRKVLNFRPDIHYINAPILPDSQAPRQVVAEIAADLNEKELLNVRNLMDSVEKLATVTQLRLDQQASTLVIGLHPDVDVAIIGAMKRKYPDSKSNEITYAQYRKCKENLTNYSLSLTQDMVLNPEKVKAAAGIPLYQIGGMNTESSLRGMNRPELQTQGQPVQPIDTNLFQKQAIKALANLLWKYAFKPYLKAQVGVLRVPLEFAPDKIFFDDGFGAIGDLGVDGLGVGGPFVDTSTVQFQGQSPELDIGLRIQELLSANQDSNPLSFEDCRLIISAFERGATFSTDPVSPFAMLTTVVQNIKIQANATKTQIDGTRAVSNPLTREHGGQAQGSNATGLIGQTPRYSTADTSGTGVNTEDQQAIDPPIFSPVGSPDFFTSNLQGVQDGKGKTDEKKVLNSLDNMFNNKCIPCALRISMSGQLLTRFAGEFSAELPMLQKYGEEMLAQLMEIINFFKNLGKNAENDACSVARTLCKVACPEDLGRIISLLGIMLSQLAMEASAAADTLLGLVAPFIQPIISGLLSVIRNFIVAIIQPIRCVIKAIVNQVRSLDSSVTGVANKLTTLGPNISLGPVQDPKTGRRLIEGSGNVGQPIIDARQKELKEYTEALKERDRIAKLPVDASKAGAIEERDEQLDKANEKLADKERDKNFTEMGKMANAIESLEPMLNQLVGLMDGVIFMISDFEERIAREVKSLMKKFIGGTGAHINTSFKKLQITQLIATVTALIKFLDKFPGCVCENLKPQDIGLLDGKGTATFAIGQDGSALISQNPKDLQEVINEVLNSFGDPATRSTINWTSNPEINTSINRAVEAVTTPVSINIKCSTVIPQTDAEKVSQWIKELDSTI